MLRRESFLVAVRHRLPAENAEVPPNCARTKAQVVADAHERIKVVVIVCEEILSCLAIGLAALSDIFKRCAKDGAHKISLRERRVPELNIFKSRIDRVICFQVKTLVLRKPRKYSMKSLLKSYRRCARAALQFVIVSPLHFDSSSPLKFPTMVI